MKYLVYCCVLLVVLSSVGCKRNQPKPTPVAIQPLSVYIVCEGNFGWGNGEIVSYDPATLKVEENIFSRNNGFKLGDVVQSITEYQDKYYIVVNNSGKIEVVDKSTFKEVAVIKGLKSPRFIQPVSADKAYVTDLYNNSVAVVNLKTLSIQSQIPIYGWTEEMLYVGGKVFVTNIHSEYLYHIDVSKDQVVDSVKLFYGTNSICQDKEGRIWVASLGDSVKGYKGGITCLASNGKDIVKQIPLSTANEYASDLKINKGGDTLYYINKHVYSLPITNSSFTNGYLFNGSGRSLYGLGVDPQNSNIYVADAKDYITKGSIYILNGSSGSLQYTFQSGMIPNGFLFKK